MSDYPRERIESLHKENVRLKWQLYKEYERTQFYRLLSIALGVMFIVALLVPREVCAAPGSSIVTMNAYPVVAGNWCSEFADGYYTGFCWNGNCEEETVPPVMCPYPKDQEDAYTRGLKEGLEAGKARELEGSL